MQLPEVAPPSALQTEKLEVGFKFIRCFAEVLKHQKVPYRPVNELTDEFVKIEIANVTRDNAEMQAGRAAAFVMNKKEGAQNVFEFSRMAVATEESRDHQFTLNFYGRWKVEELKEIGDEVQN